MFFLKTLRLRNFRNHKKLDLEFKEGITGIFGPNGTGKSSIIEAIQFLLVAYLEDTKERVIKTGETTGYVSGTFVLNEKEGKLERHLDSAKVLLEYDGKVYKKSGEVKELWDTMLQITPLVFTNVIVAAQGEIPKLFVGDEAEREKIFQKIFMVPNTTKIRTVLLDYIKNAPPEYFVKNEEDITAQAMALAGEQIELDRQLKEYTCPTPEAQADLLRQRQDIIRGLNEASTREADELALTTCKDKNQEATEALAQVNAKLNSIDLTAYESQLQQLTVEEQHWNMRQRLIGSIELLERRTFDLQEGADYDQAIHTLEGSVAELTKDVNNSTKECADLTAELKQYDSIRGHVDCPTCHQRLPDLQSFLAEKQQKLLKAQVALSSTQPLLQEQHNALTEYKKRVADNDLTHKEISVLQTQLGAIPNVSYEPSSLVTVRAVIAKYKELLVQQSALNTEIQKSNQTIHRLEVSLAQKFDLGMTVMEARLKVDQLLDTEHHNNNIITAYENLRFAATVKQQELEACKKEYQTNAGLIAKNKVRHKYVEDLKAVYDALHTSEFPRKFIQTYAAAVTEDLATNLAAFNFPYTAEVNDNFTIEIRDQNNWLLPKVSVGQQMLVGLALRFALHSMFSQAFPMMILDEGTTSLSTLNKQLYFEAVERLKDDAKLRQIIIIDHDAGLSKVVDNVIELK